MKACPAGTLPALTNDGAQAYRCVRRPEGGAVEPEPGQRVNDAVADPGQSGGCQALAGRRAQLSGSARSLRQEILSLTAEIRDAARYLPRTRGHARRLQALRAERRRRLAEVQRQLDQAEESWEQDCEAPQEE